MDVTAKLNDAQKSLRKAKERALAAGGDEGQDAVGHIEDAARLVEEAKDIATPAPPTCCIDPGPEHRTAG